MPRVVVVDKIGKGSSEDPFRPNIDTKKILGYYVIGETEDGKMVTVIVEENEKPKQEEIDEFVKRVTKEMRDKLKVCHVWTA